MYKTIWLAKARVLISVYLNKYKRVFVEHSQRRLHGHSACAEGIIAHNSQLEAYDIFRSEVLSTTTKEIMTDKLNREITDAVTSSNVNVVANAPAIGLSELYQTDSHSTGLSVQNSVNAQQQLNTLDETAATQGVMQIYSIDTVSDAIPISQILNMDNDPK